MLPNYFNTKPLADYMRHDLKIPADQEAGSLSAGRVGRIAALAAASSAAYAATGHLLALVALLPTPAAAGEGTGDQQDFWLRLTKAAGSATLLPGNIKIGVVAALDGHGAGLADRLLDAVGTMSTEHRAATALLVGEHLTDSGGFPGPASTTGELWLRDVELTAWQVIHNYRRPPTRQARDQFRDAWNRV
ncbi:hypothetical protein [Streptomyces spiramenti]|uniref:Uncharacterized protein n=1 Tax=Streptomyces spiramenti TaxID=2720606 RepID=A0ABX1AJU7_9ACTN|nr:hypothetical protein [Streptomyces spiramenti]NJP65931.1 hypothetical protein [Streptomyces spiramenti]